MQDGQRKAQRRTVASAKIVDYIKFIGSNTYHSLCFNYDLVCCANDKHSSAFFSSTVDYRSIHVYLSNHPLVHFTIDDSTVIPKTILFGATTATPETFDKFFNSLLDDLNAEPSRFAVIFEIFPTETAKMNIYEISDRKELLLIISFQFRVTPSTKLNTWLSQEIQATAEISAKIQTRISQMENIISKVNPSILVSHRHSSSTHKSFFSKLQQSQSKAEDSTTLKRTISSNKAIQELSWTSYYSKSIRCIQSTTIIFEIVHVSDILKQSETWWIVISPLSNSLNLPCFKRQISCSFKELKHAIGYWGTILADPTVSISFSIEYTNAKLEIQKGNKWTVSTLDILLLVELDTLEMILRKEKMLGSMVRRISYDSKRIEEMMRKVKKTQPSLLIALKPIAIGSKVPIYDEFRLSHSFVSYLD